MNYKVEFINYNRERTVRFYSVEKPIDELMDFISSKMFSDEGFGEEKLNWDDIRLVKIRSRDGQDLSKRLPFNPKRRRDALELLGGKCVVCGKEDADDLEFDHIDPATKSFNIASNWSRSWGDLQKELAKCQLLCTKCHDDKTLRERPPARHGTIFMYRDNGCRCEACRARKKQTNDIEAERRRLKKLGQQLPKELEDILNEDKITT